jgi:hypothetical protein
MNLLDENIPDSQRQLLRSWRVRTQQVGQEIGRRGMRDSEVISVLHRLGGVTLFTRDLGLCHPHLCHARYCLVCLAVGQYESASFIRRLLRHPAFNTHAKRLGKVLRVSHAGIRVWRLGAEAGEAVAWLG